LCKPALNITFVYDELMFIQIDLPEEVLYFPEEKF
jgi:hypothetical protein